MRLMLAPAPKIYEIFVLLKTLEAIEKKHGRVQAKNIRRFMLKSDSHQTIYVYYNYPPRKSSRFIYKMTGSRPHPDILVEYQTGTRIVIDAKYRLGLVLEKNHRPVHGLGLGDALRFLGYLTDLAHNGVLRGIIAVPNKGENHNKLKECLDSTLIEIDLVEVNPSKGASELAQLLP